MGTWKLFIMGPGPDGDWSKNTETKKIMNDRCVQNNCIISGNEDGCDVEHALDASYVHDVASDDGRDQGAVPRLHLYEFGTYGGNM